MFIGLGVRTNAIKSSRAIATLWSTRATEKVRFDLYFDNLFVHQFTLINFSLAELAFLGANQTHAESKFTFQVAGRQILLGLLSNHAH